MRSTNGNPPHPAIVQHDDGSMTTYSQRCTQCGLTQLLDNFGPDKRMHLGRKSECRACQRKSNDRRRARPGVRDRDNARDRQRRREQKADARARLRPDGTKKHCQSRARRVVV